MSDSLPLILASQSPRRKAFLTELGFTFSCQSADIDEAVIGDESPEIYVERLARAKAATIAKRHDSTTIVLGADTCVAINDKILGKPEDYQQCLQYLQLLSGETHQVHTAIAVVQGELSKSLVVSTQVDFDQLTEQDIRQYWLSKEPQDKAGAYGIQGLGGQFVKSIQGSYSAVVGLPLCETKHLLAEFGLFNLMHIGTATEDSK